MEAEADAAGSTADAQDLVFLLDVDNTLLDNDALKLEIGRRVEAVVGRQRAERFWQLYEEVRQEEDYVDYPQTLVRFLAESGSSANPAELGEIFHGLPFSSFLYPGVMETLDYLKSLGTVVILSDGDQVFQAAKIRNSGLADAVEGRVLIYVHKELELPKVFAQYPAGHYVAVDDKARILSAIEVEFHARFTTVFVLQGHYAREGEFKPEPDIVIHHIAELRDLTKEQLIRAGAERTAAT